MREVDLLIIGAGPAGCSAGGGKTRYCGRRGAGRAVINYAGY